MKTPLSRTTVGASFETDAAHDKLIKLIQASKGMNGRMVRDLKDRVRRGTGCVSSGLWRTARWLYVRFGRHVRVEERRTTECATSSGAR